MHGQTNILCLLLLFLIPPSLCQLSCLSIPTVSVRFGLGPGYPEGIPGRAGAPRFGIPERSPSALNVRRSWSSLSTEEQKRVIDGFVLLQKTTVGSGMPGAERADYNTYCEGAYTRNLYDFYPELHQSCYASWGTGLQSWAQRCHQGPHFLPWHRYFILRVEADLKEVLGDPTFTLPYWDYDDCGEGPDGCPALFDSALGGPGSCSGEGSKDAEQAVDGYLTEQGFKVHVDTVADVDVIFNAGSVTCVSRDLTRQVGCQTSIESPPSSLELIARGAERLVYDVPPYDSCRTDESVSFRQYIEGFVKQMDPTAPLTSGAQISDVVAGQANITHSRAHLYVSGDLGLGSAASDPLFFMLHANIDRIWAMWQDNNINLGNDDYFGNPGYPEAFLGPLFNFPETSAEDVLNYKSLGYCYSTSSCEPFTETPAERSTCFDPDNLLPIPENSKQPNLTLGVDTFYVEKLTSEAGVDGIYFATSGGYNGFFIVAPTISGEGVLVADAPIYGSWMKDAIESITDAPVTKFIYSHAHEDHVAFANDFESTATYYGHVDTANFLKARANDNGGIPTHPIPDIFFCDNYTLSHGNYDIELSYFEAFNAHGPGSIYIWVPEPKIFMAVDRFYPRWCPFRRLGESDNITALLADLDQILAFPFEKFIGGHLGLWGTREDVVNGKLFYVDLLEVSAQTFATADTSDYTFMLADSNFWAFTRIGRDTDACTCQDILVERWGHILGGVDVFAASGCSMVHEAMRLGVNPLDVIYPTGEEVQEAQQCSSSALTLSSGLFVVMFGMLL